MRILVEAEEEGPKLRLKLLTLGVSPVLAWCIILAYDESEQVVFAGQTDLHRLAHHDNRRGLASPYRASEFLDGGEQRVEEPIGAPHMLVGYSDIQEARQRSAILVRVRAGEVC